MAFKLMSLLLLLVLAAVCSSAPSFLGSSDEVTSMPGLHVKLNFHHYSGYLASVNDSQLHYWFFESQNDPANDPVVLWLNGGPGCSSLLGAFTENGPITLTKSESLYLNTNAWNQKANILYLESPAGVGFSYNLKHDYKTGDNATAKLNYEALKSFYVKFPQYVKNEFYITGESYGGVYIPTLAALVQEGGFPASFRGVAIGNGYLEQTMLANSLLHFTYNHGLYGKVLWDNMLTACCQGVSPIENCDFVNSQNGACIQAVSKVQTKLNESPLNWYNIYGDCDHSAGPSAPKSLTPDQVAKRLVRSHLLKHAEYTAFQLQDDPPCVNLDFVANYLNQKDVRSALHISAQSEDWSPCSADVNGNYTNEYTSLTTVVRNLLNNGLKVLIYNGDIDTVCNFLGDQWFVEGLGETPAQEYSPWLYQKPYVGQQVAGYYKLYNGLAYTTIRGSGHTVPTDKPVVAYIMFDKFIDWASKGKSSARLFD